MALLVVRRFQGARLVMTEPEAFDALLKHTRPCGLCQGTDKLCPEGRALFDAWEVTQEEARRAQVTVQAS